MDSRKAFVLALQEFMRTDVDYDLYKEIDQGDWEVTWDDLAEKFLDYLTAYSCME